MKALEREAGTHLHLPNLNCAMARNVQPSWAKESIIHRLQFVRHLRHEIATHAHDLAGAAAAVAGRPVAEKLISEVLPLADACRWLEKNAARLLADQYHNRKRRPVWLRGVSFCVHRQPLGLVLIIGPANYPLFLPAVQALHALVAGNAVLLKPAPLTREAASMFAQFAKLSGLDSRLLSVLPEDISAARACLVAGVDKVVFTGSSENGRIVLEQLAASNTPSVMELSGADAMVVLKDADLDLVVSALHFGTQWNGGDTCIAPRRLLAHEAIAQRLRDRLSDPILNHFTVEEFFEENDAVEFVSGGKFGLGVSIFSRDQRRAAALGERMQTGFVTVNDLIAPTADPRMPFGGLRGSGFGVTRGAEGLLEMTHPHVVATRRGKSRAHLQPLTGSDSDLFSAYISAAHSAKFATRWRAARRIVQLLMIRKREIK